MSDFEKISTNWNYPTSIRFGAGRISELASVCKELNINKPLLTNKEILFNLTPEL